jgi:hypothetical protein
MVKYCSPQVALREVFSIQRQADEIGDIIFMPPSSTAKINASITPQLALSGYKNAADFIGFD